jgi:hypothetical protein
MPHLKSSTESLACRFHRNLNSRSKYRQKGDDFRMKTQPISHDRCESFCAPPRCGTTKTGIAHLARNASARTVIRALAYF